MRWLPRFVLLTIDIKSLSSHPLSHPCFLSYVLQVRQEPPEAMVHLRDSVKGRFTELMSGVSDADLQRHSKVVAFKDSVRKYAIQGGTQHFLQHSIHKNTCHKWCHSLMYILYIYVYAAGQTADENEGEELDEDIAVTQSQTNFICPLTQVNIRLIKCARCYGSWVKSSHLWRCFCVLFVLHE